MAKTRLKIDGETTADGAEVSERYRALEKDGRVEVRIRLPRSALENAATARLREHVDMPEGDLALVGAVPFLMRDYGHWYDGELVGDALVTAYGGRSRDELRAARAQVMDWFDAEIRLANC